MTAVIWLVAHGFIEQECSPRHSVQCFAMIAIAANLTAPPTWCAGCVDATPEKCIVHTSLLIRCLKMTAIIHIVDVRYNNVKLTVTREWSVSKTTPFAGPSLHNINCTVLLPMLRNSYCYVYTATAPHGPLLRVSLLDGSRCCSSAGLLPLHSVFLCLFPIRLPAQ